MTTENLQMTITAVDHASAVVDRLMSKMKQLTSMASKISANPTKGLGSLDTSKAVRDNFTKSQAEAMKGLRQRFAFETRMHNQRIAGERAVAAEQGRTARQQEQQQSRQQAQQERARRIGESATMAGFRRQMAFTSNLARQRATLESDAERSRARSIAASERQHAAQIRQQIQGHRYLFGLRERTERQEQRSAAQAAKSEESRRTAAYRNLGRGVSHTRDAGRGIMDSARTVTVYGAVAGGIISQLARNGISARSRADTAEANARMFGNLSRQQVDQARSGWLNSAAVENGFRPADAINAFTEVLKAGIPQASAPDVAKSIMGASAGLDLNVADTTKLVGRLSTLTQDPKSFSSGAIDQMLNGIAVVAKVTAADSKELVSSLRRGAGVLGSSRMSVTDLTAFTGTGISAGMQEGKAGTFMDFLVNDLVNAKNSRGQRGKDLASGLSLAGVGGVEQVSRQAANDPTQLLLKLFGNMSKMDPAKAGRVASLIGMREWRGEILQMMKAFPMLKQTVEAGRDPANAGHLAQARDERLGTLAGLGSQLRATFDLAWEAIGGGIEDIARDIGRFFVNLGGKLNLDVIKAHVASLLNGFVDGLGFANVTEMLNKVFGKPDFSTVNSFFRFAQGFGQGVREVIDTVRSAFSMFAGKDADAETMGNLAAKILSLSVALVTLAPAIGVMGSLTAIIGGLAFAVGGIAKGATGLGLFGGAGVLTAAGGIIGAAVLATIADKLGILKGPDVSKGWGRGIVDFLDPGLASRIYGDGKAAPTDAQKRGPANALDGADKGVIQKQSFQADNPLAGLIQKASMTTGYDGRDDAIERLSDNVRTMGARFQLAALSGPGTGSGLGSSLGGGGGAGGGAVSSPSSKFFKPDGMSVPGWYGKGSGGGSASSNPANSKASAAMLDAIAATESGKAGYDTVLGNGKYGMPSKPVSTMSLDEAFRFGRTVKARHGSSSALGRYQIVGNTMRAAQKALGIGGDATFDGPMQDRMARWIARNQGLGAWEGLKGNGAKMAAARAALAAGGASDAPVGGGVAGISPNLGGVVPSLDGLRIKGAQATGGGSHAAGLSALARSIQDGGIAGGLNRFTAFNDQYHQGRRSKHNEGLASDFTLNDPSKSAEAAEQVRQRLRAAGLPDNAFKVIDEYRNPSGHATGGHVHVQFAGKEWAEKYRQSVEQAKAALQPKLATGDGGGWKAGAGGNAEALGMGVPAKSAAERAVENVPMSTRRPAGVGTGGGGGGGTVNINQTINGGQNTPQEIANLSQRQITKDWNHRSHDVEFDMA
ncbi:phage tail tape measure protein [Methylobacterium sp. Leaf89]|uniref:phage tail tape measure protein n=1 Tax=Methylobacterium sp. Leaf89 TaxID=1736245 RepID=UPI0006FF223B|nr:phage tail tape measure protein [Methylobacterium sp. Leaf89]KQO73452.1 hypothetical protein ASF18_16810 [Methylobacterium sp. Leaf89]